MASLEMILENLLASIRSRTSFLSIPFNKSIEGVSELMRIAISKKLVELTKYYHRNLW